MTASEATDLTRLKMLLTEHAQLRSTESTRLQNAIGELLRDFHAKREEWAAVQRATADDFDLFQVMGVAGDEMCHSKMLAWLLDHRIERGTHAQGNLGLQLFLKEMQPELGDESYGRLARYADDLDYWVYTEVAGDESRIDVEVAATRKFLIHIENKIHAAEGDDQTDREWIDLQARREELRVPESNCRAIFLTPDGREAENKRFLPFRWGRIAKVLDSFAREAQPADVKLFTRHFAAAVRKMSDTEPGETEPDDAEL